MGYTDLNAIVKDVKENSNGSDIVGVYKRVEGDNKGVDIIGLCKGVEGDNKGVDIVGVYKAVEGDNKGLSLTGGFNYFKEVNDFSVSYATIGNVIKEVGENVFYLQVGLWNKAGDSYCPIINIGGIKNIPKIIKENFKIKKGSKLEQTSKTP